MLSRNSTKTIRITLRIQAETPACDGTAHSRMARMLMDAHRPTHMLTTAVHLFARQSSQRISSPHGGRTCFAHGHATGCGALPASLFHHKSNWGSIYDAYCIMRYGLRSHKLGSHAYCECTLAGKIRAWFHNIVPRSSATRDMEARPGRNARRTTRYAISGKRQSTDLRDVDTLIPAAADATWGLATGNPDRQASRQAGWGC